MNYDRTGIILYTRNYVECINFYREILELETLFQTEALTCFQFGESYLMVEIDDEDDSSLQKSERIRTCLRMHVPDVKKQYDKLVSKNIKVQYQEHSWGIIAKFFDPDGNLCAFKDTDTFEEQINKYRNAKTE